MDATTATRPTRLLPQMEAADHHLRWIDQAVMQSWNVARSESTCPMCFFQTTSETRLAVGGSSECEEAILEVTGQQGCVSQVFDRLSLGAQHPLYSFDDL